MAAETISRNQKALIRSLSTKKGRKEHLMFLVEGEKSVEELLNSAYEVVAVYSSNDQFQSKKAPVHLISRQDIASISALSTPSPVLALAKIPEKKELVLENSLVLDRIQDPGNLGTIIRIADWFGIRQVVCSEGTVELYNPKTIQATMGSFTRVDVVYTDIKEAVTRFVDAGIPVYAATLNGDAPGDAGDSNKKVLILGSESHGIHPEILTTGVKKITIPGSGNAESLNVSIAAGILSYELFTIKQ